MTVEEWEAVLRVNLSGPFFMIKAVLDTMVEQGFGRIVNVSSVVGEAGNFGQANYAAAKAGLIGLTKTVALEVAKRGVTVNAIAPGFIDTEMTKAMPPEAIEMRSRRRRCNSSASPTKSHDWCASCSTRKRGTSPARCTISTAVGTCNDVLRLRRMMTPDELKYGIDVTGLDPASLGDAVRAVVTDAMNDPMRMTTWMTGFALAEQNVGLNMLRRLSGQAPAANPYPGDKRFSDPGMGAESRFSQASWKIIARAPMRRCNSSTPRDCPKRRGAKRSLRCNSCATPFRPATCRGSIPAW